MPEAPPNPANIYEPSTIPTTPQGGNAVAAALHSGEGYGPLASPAELNAGSGAGTGIGSGISDLFSNLTPTQKMLAGAGAGIGATMYADRKKYGVPAKQKYTGALSQFSYDPSTYKPYTMAEGGIAALAGGGQANLGSYSDGGHLLKGPGDGMSDNIPASIGKKQPARLADGEFVIPADVVSHLGNGSTDAGAKQLYHMMNKVRKARTGNPKQGTQINPRKYMPA
jgi:hypothetical protein